MTDEMVAARNATNTAEEYAQAWSELNWRGILRLIDDTEFVYDDYATGAHCDTKEQFRDECMPRMAAVDDLKWEPRDLSAGVSFAVVHWLMQGRDPETGEPFRTPGVSVLRIRGGKITREARYHAGVPMPVEKAMPPT